MCSWAQDRLELWFQGTGSSLHPEPRLLTRAEGGDITGGWGVSSPAQPGVGSSPVPQPTRAFSTGPRASGPCPGHPTHPGAAGSAGEPRGGPCPGGGFGAAPVHKDPHLLGPASRGAPETAADLSVHRHLLPKQHLCVSLLLLPPRLSPDLAQPGPCPQSSGLARSPAPGRIAAGRD